MSTNKQLKHTCACCCALVAPCRPSEFDKLAKKQKDAADDKKKHRKK